MTPANDDGFRPGQDFAAPKRPAPAAPEAPAVLAFTEAADAAGTDLDVLMGYQLLLGRDPENSAVIADAKNSPVRAFIKALLVSDEFQSGVAAKLEAGAALPHELGSHAPSDRQRDWLLRHLSLPDYAETMLRSAPTWRDFTRVLLRVPGVPRSNAAPQAAPAAAEARRADDGFVLIHLEQPKPGQPILPGARVAGSGWTIAPADIAEVAILLDETVLTHARYGLKRADVMRAFPHYRHVDHCGFDFVAVIPADYRVSFASRLVVRVRTVRGDEGEKGVRLLPPLARETGPAEDTVIGDAAPMRLAIDEAMIDEGRVLRLRGWAAARAGIADVRISLGEAELAQAVTGLARPDIAKANPDLPEAGQSGFALVHGLPAGLAEGPGFVRVQATDRRGQTRQMTAPVIVPPAPAVGALGDGNPELAQSTGITCSCDVAALCGDGRFAAIGWALADKGIRAIDVELDGLSAGRAQLAVPRLDIAAQHPQHAHAGTAGFTFVSPTPRRLAPGPHILTLRFKSRGGGTRVLELPLEAVPVAELPSAVQALLEPPIDRSAPPAPRAPAVELRLEMDQPALDGAEAREALQGALSISGWAVARTGIEGVSVFLDDTLLGAAHIGMRREDIGAAYPDLPGSLLAGYALVLPLGALAEGRHEIKVVATAKAVGANSAARAEKRFFLKVEPFHAVPPGGTPREKIPPAEQALGEALLAQASARPHFRLLVEADGDAALPSLARTLASLAAQVYAEWSAQVLLPESARAAALTLPQAADPAGRITFSADRDMPAGTPRFLAKLRAGDVLGADALLAMALAVAADPAADLLYSDELRFDPAQQRMQPFFKPDFSPELLLSMNYPGRLCCAAQALVQAAGFTPAGFGAAGDYDAILRLAEHARKIVHLPRVLCTRGNALDSPAAEQAALAAALKRRKRRGIVAPGTIKGTWRIRRPDPAAGPRGASGDATLVSIIMPTCSARGLVRRAIAAIRATTAPARPGGPAVEIVVLDNTPASDRASRAWLRRNADTVIDMPGPFNWSRFNNAGAAAARGSYLLFLNDDIEMPQADWLDVLLEQASRPQVGVVGARLLYPGGTVQHAGQYLADGHARHAFRFADPQNPGPFGLATVTREMIAVTGACQLMRRAVFDRLGGYEEAHSIVNNDLDFCLRSWQAGLAVIYTPQASLVHHELASRARLEDTYDAERFSGAWRALFLQGDPYRNPHLGPDSDHYGPEPEPAVWLHAGRGGVPAETIKRILVVKLDHIGDFLTAHPALAALAAAFPQAAIDLLVPGATAALARQGGMLPAGVKIHDIEIFDFFHAVSGKGRKEVGASELAALEARLAPRAYDLAIDLRMHPETRTVLRHTGARACAGFEFENRFPWLDVALEWEGDVRLVRKRTHVSERLVQLVAATQAACGAEPPAHQGGAAKRPPSKAFDALPAAFRARSIVCIHPGVGNAVRQWPAASFAALIDLLAARPGLNAVLIGSPDEAAIADEILQKVADPERVVSLVGRLKLAELPPLMQRCALFVGNNSGPQHIAATLGLKTLGIHSGVVDASEWAPCGPQAMAIRRRMVCSPCYLEFASDCPRDLACLTGLLPREVHAACLHLLGGNASSQKPQK